MRSKKLLLLIFIVLIGFAFLIYKITDKQKTELDPSRHISLGAWTEGLYDAKSNQLHPEALLQFEKLVHKKVSIAHYYLGWEYLTNPILISQFNTLRSNGWEPMLNVNPYFFSKCPSSSLTLYRAIAEGKCDDFLYKAGKNLSNIRQPFYLLFAWEMNNPQNQWSISYTGSTNEDFIQAWRHIYSVFKDENVKNVIWVFCPNVPDNQNIPYAKIYPGNNFVDWVGMDGYNWGKSQPWSQWVSFSGVFMGSYKTLVKLAPNKSFMIAEANSNDQGGDKAAWYKDMLTKQIPYNFPKIKAVVFFNENRSKQENVNWDININPQVLQSFISSVHTKFYY